MAYTIHTFDESARPGSRYGSFEAPGPDLLNDAVASLSRSELEMFVACAVAMMSPDQTLASLETAKQFGTSYTDRAKSRVLTT